jgi:hypothetical protein
MLIFFVHGLFPSRFYSKFARQCRVPGSFIFSDLDLVPPFSGLDPSSSKISLKKTWGRCFVIESEFLGCL